MFALIKFFLVFVLIAVFVVIMIGLSFVAKLFSLFRPTKKTSQYTDYSSTNSQSRQYGGRQYGNQQYGGQQGPTQTTQKKKIIPADEGEYVEFEEVE